MTQLWDYDISLMSTVDTVDEDGFPTGETSIPISVMANRLSVNSSEFYQSNNQGFVIAEVFEIHSIEYNGEETLLFDGDNYRIRRTFPKGEYIELYCEKRDVDHG